MGIARERISHPQRGHGQAVAITKEEKCKTEPQY